MTSNSSPRVPLDDAERPPVDPGLEVVLALVNAPGARRTADMTPPEARESFKMLTAVAGDPLTGLAIDDRTIPGPPARSRSASTDPPRARPRACSSSSTAAGS